MVSKDGSFNSTPLQCRKVEGIMSVLYNRVREEEVCSLGLIVSYPFTDTLSPDFVQPQVRPPSCLYRAKATWKYDLQRIIGWGGSCHSCSIGNTKNKGRSYMLAYGDILGT